MPLPVRQALHHGFELSLSLWSGEAVAAAKTLDEQAWWAWAGERIKVKLPEPDLDLTTADDPRARKDGCDSWTHVLSHV
jgi:hypothetical protein